MMRVTRPALMLSDDGIFILWINCEKSQENAAVVIFSVKITTAFYFGGGVCLSEFKNYHPIINFIYFMAVFVFSCLFFNPVLLIISLVSGFSYSVFLNGVKALKFNLVYMLPALVLTALVNPIFNHEGLTVLWHFPGGSPLTLEALVYGLCSACMLCSVICHFSCFNKIFTSDKFIYLFGKILPSFTLILSMVLRFVPRFKMRFKEVYNAQKSIGINAEYKGIINRVKGLIRIISVMLTWSLENAVDTAYSMKSRGYGTAKRTSYSNYILSKRDVFILIYILFLIFIIGFLSAKGSFRFEFYPSLKGVQGESVMAYAVYAILFFTPIITELWEVLKWNLLKSKI